MLEIIDLSQKIFTGMPVFPGLPEVKITVHQSHEELEGIVDGGVVSPAVNLLELGEHTGTHVDAISHVGREHRRSPMSWRKVFGSMSWRNPPTHASGHD